MRATDAAQCARSVQEVRGAVGAYRVLACVPSVIGKENEANSEIPCVQSFVALQQ